MMKRFVTVLAAGAALSLMACSGDDALPITPVALELSETTVVGEEAVLGRIPLVAGVDVVMGVTVEPDTGRRLVLVGGTAVHELRADGVDPVPLWQGSSSAGNFLDLVAVGGGEIAMTATSDGFLVNLDDGTLRQHFCYLPGWQEEGGGDPIQVATALAYDPQSDLIFAQPRTIENGGWGEISESLISVHDGPTGVDEHWWSVDDIEFLAQGMVVLERGRDVDSPRLLLGVDATLFVFDADQRVVSARYDLAEQLNVGAITGMAMDRNTDSLLVLDGGNRHVLELDLDALDLR